MTCPFCKINLEESILSGVSVHYCSRCLGLWFEEGELRWAKDKKDEDLKWFDVDLWQDLGKFKISRDRKLCPKDRLPLYEVSYGDSDVSVDVCNICRGIWLDRGEFAGIMEYLAKKTNFEILNNYLRNLKEELWEVFAGPELLREEILDFLAILKMLKYKFAAQYPNISRIISKLPK